MPTEVVCLAACALAISRASPPRPRAAHLEQPTNAIEERAEDAERRAAESQVSDWRRGAKEEMGVGVLVWVEARQRRLGGGARSDSACPRVPLQNTLLTRKGT